MLVMLSLRFALAGVAAEFGVVMLVCLDNALESWRKEGRLRSVEDLKGGRDRGGRGAAHPA
ncbi:MAG: hypothetical protein VBE63_05890 [Lamprobacter sp.]|nr:hypothetical protein [Lamprobacter sp.]MEA3639459.1 hypothetical protein [Lamprobacter sp.]